MRIKKQGIFGSQILFDSTPREGGSDYWRALFYLNIYRMLLAVFLVTASLATINVGSLGSKHPDLFLTVSVSYAFLCIFYIFFIHKSWPQYVAQCRIQILTDIIVILLLYYASGGRGAGLEILLFISVSASGILLGGRGALSAASVATILLILVHFYAILTNQRPLGGFTTLGFIGGGLFVTAFVIYYLSLLLRRTEKEVAQQYLDLQKMGHINELIVEQLHSGVIVIDQSLRIILINQSGRNLLGLTENTSLPPTLDGLLPEINFDTSDLKHDSDTIDTKIKLASGKTLLTRYKPLGNTFENGYIILLDDYSQIEQEQRNEKFIDMGRLSASIAHEIRNPLGAISHAGQLLAESPLIIKDDSRLVEIIENQSQRINQIIQTILDMGQSRGQNPEKIAIYDWLETIANNFSQEKGLSEPSILLEGSKLLQACGDPVQLQQVILNLLSNSFRYANTSSSPFIIIKIEGNSLVSETTISIFDNGPGIDRSIQENIFEPFFTSSSTGNGLGLYIARKICINNDAYLDYIDMNDGNNHFMITFHNNKTCQEEG